MATTFKVLGQSNPAGNTATTLYTVPSSTSTVVSSINVCNLDVSNATFRIAVRPAGASLANTHYVCYNAPVPGYDTVSLSLGLTLATTDVLTVYGSTSNITFSAFGSEVA